MVLNASSKIAVKCSECGKYNTMDLNIFKMKIPTSQICDCGHSVFKGQISKSQLIFYIDCIACEKQHKYRFKLKDLMERPVNIMSCPITGMEVAFLGKDDCVDDIVVRYMNDTHELLKSLGVIENITV